ncbi:hypothetical protein NUM3379_03570 [Kineococcus sp. NUM-3379]
MSAPQGPVTPGGGPPAPSGGRRLLLLAGAMVAIVLALVAVAVWAQSQR